MRWLNVEQSFRALPFSSILFLAVAVASQDVCSFRSDTKVAANATKTFFSISADACCNSCLESGINNCRMASFSNYVCSEYSEVFGTISASGVTTIFPIQTTTVLTTTTKAPPPPTTTNPPNYFVEVTQCLYGPCSVYKDGTCTTLAYLSGTCYQGTVRICTTSHVLMEEYQNNDCSGKLIRNNSLPLDSCVEPVDERYTEHACNIRVVNTSISKIVRSICSGQCSSHEVGQCDSYALENNMCTSNPESLFNGSSIFTQIFGSVVAYSIFQVDGRCTGAPDEILMEPLRFCWFTIFGYQYKTNTPLAD